MVLANYGPQGRIERVFQNESWRNLSWSLSEVCQAVLGCGQDWNRSLRIYNQRCGGTCYQQQADGDIKASGSWSKFIINYERRLHRNVQIINYKTVYRYHLLPEEAHSLRENMAESLIQLQVEEF